MNDRDRNNAHFLLSASKEELTQWYKSVSADEIQYATSILNEMAYELDDIALSLEEQPTDFSEAKQILSQFTLKESK